jgi:hypothetical protein
MINNPDDQGYREIVWRELINGLTLDEQSFVSLGFPDRVKFPDRYTARKEQLINAELERRRIFMVQRENRNRAVRGEPMIDPFTGEPIK